MAPKSKAKAKAKAPPPELAPLEVEPQVTEEALEAAKQLKREEKAAMRAAREAEVAEQTAKMNFEVQVNETIEEGRKLEAEIKEAKDLGLSPFKAVRIRRKSKDLESSATDLLSTALDEIFLSCNCGLKTWPLIAVSGRGRFHHSIPVQADGPLRAAKAHGNTPRCQAANDLGRWPEGRASL